MKDVNLNELAKKAFESAKAKGFHDEKHTDGHWLMLVMCELAEAVEADRFYFFNPFSVEILRKVMARILESYYAEPREMMLYFYYPSDEYISYLMTVPELEFYDEISFEDLFDGENERERVIVFRIP